jgi:hypothetical protein
MAAFAVTSFFTKLASFVHNLPNQGALDSQIGINGQINMMILYTKCLDLERFDWKCQDLRTS